MALADMLELPDARDMEDPLFAPIDSHLGIQSATAPRPTSSALGSASVPSHSQAPSPSISLSARYV